MSKQTPAYQAMRKEISWAWGRMSRLTEEIQLCQDELERREGSGEGGGCQRCGWGAGGRQQNPPLIGGLPVSEWLSGRGT